MIVNDNFDWFLFFSKKKIKKEEIKKNEKKMLVRKRRSSLAGTLPVIIMLVMMLYSQSGHSLKWCGQISSVNMDADLNARRHMLRYAIFFLLQMRIFFFHLS
jgi:hypothetical protein